MKRLAILLLALPMAANAGLITVDFEITGFADGATMSGTFSGIDAVDDGLLLYDELTDFTLSWSGNSQVDAFFHTFANLAETYTSTNAFDFQFDLIAIDLLSFSSCDALAPDGCARPTAFRNVLSSTFFAQNEAFVSTGSASTNASYIVTTVPEPGTLALLGLGLAGLGFARRKKQA